jgi:hypothetical protein
MVVSSMCSMRLIGGGYYVRVTLPDGTVDRIEGFAREGDAGQWIKLESGVASYR